MSSRTKNTIRNSIVGFWGQILTVLFSFIARTFFVNKLGISNLGYDTLFSNILSVLSITDLGMTTALTYALYLPLHNKNYPKISAIIAYFRRIFIVIGILLLVISVIITPYIDFFVNVPYNADLSFIRLIFILYAINSFSTYFFVDMRILLEADQKGYVISTINCISKILVKIFQILVLYLYEDYILYLGVEIIFTILSNIYIQLKVKRIYNLKKYKNEYEWAVGEKKQFFSNVFYVSLNKIASIGINSTDSLIISKVVGTAILGLYSNYTLIIGTVYALIDKLLLGCTASLGNLFAESDVQKEQSILSYLQYITAMLASFMFIFLSLFVHKAIGLWLGDSMKFAVVPIFIVCLNQYFFMNRKFLEIVVQAKGVFKKTMPIKVLEAVINLFLSILLAVKIGITGVFLGSTVSLLISYFLELYVLIKKTFDMNYMNYVLKQLQYFCVNFLIYFIILVIIKLIPRIEFGKIWIELFVSGSFFLVLNYMFYKNSENFQKIKHTFLNIFFNRIKNL